MRTPVEAWIILIVLALVWGSSFILIKLSLAHGLAPMEVGALRLVCAGVVLLPFMLKHLRKLTKSETWAIVAVGLVGTGIPATLFPLAQQVISSSLSGMINSLAPLFTLLLGAAFFSFPFTPRKLVGVMIGFIGALVLIGFPSEGGDRTQQVLYALIAVLATFGYGISTNIMKRYLNETHPFLVTTLAIFLVAIPYLVYVSAFTSIPTKLISGHTETWKALGFVALLGVFGTGMALVLFNRLIQLTEPVFSSSVTYLIPIVALGWGVWDGEQIGLTQVMGMGIILTGVFLVNRSRQKT